MSTLKPRSTQEPISSRARHTMQILQQRRKIALSFNTQAAQSHSKPIDISKVTTGHFIALQREEIQLHPPEHQHKLLQPGNLGKPLIQPNPQIQVNPFMAQDKPFSTKIIPKYILWVELSHLSSPKLEFLPLTHPITTEKGMWNQTVYLNFKNILNSLIKPPIHSMLLPSLQVITASQVPLAASLTLSLMLVIISPFLLALKCHHMAFAIWDSYHPTDTRQRALFSPEKKG
ncbi:hypothetical protein MG293_001579 [Ovis ammon polii]|uniref:Uncharacterized protein n=1 Tax=Ovis ammon polii TaxID=230172 RepID=A0AAD4YI64_OVIAM|nr:hypothetical protein MG293_001579 [Ovis ammon polii]